MRFLIVAMTLLLLGACSLAPTAQTPTSAPALVPTTVAAAPTAPAPLPTTLADAHQELVTQVQVALLAEPTVDDTTLTFQRMQPETWPTSALGCPAPGQLYTQVLTPGYLVIFGDTTRTYAIHTTEEGRPLVWCDAGTPKQVGRTQTG